MHNTADKTAPLVFVGGQSGRECCHEAVKQMAKPVPQEEYWDPDGSVCPSAPHLAPALQLGVNLQLQREHQGKTRVPSNELCSNPLK